MGFAREQFKSNTDHSQTCGEVPVDLRDTAKVPFNCLTPSPVCACFYFRLVCVQHAERSDKYSPSWVFNKRIIFPFFI